MSQHYQQLSEELLVYSSTKYIFTFDHYSTYFTIHLEKNGNMF